MKFFKPVVLAIIVSILNYTAVFGYNQVQFENITVLSDVKYNADDIGESIDTVTLKMIEHSNKNTDQSYIKYVTSFMKECKSMAHYAVERLSNVITVDNSLLDSLIEYRNMNCKPSV